MCPLGYCIVCGYERTTRSGEVVPVHSYLRKLPEKSGSRLYPENLQWLYWHSGVNFGHIHDIKGYGGKGAAYDAAIQFWLDYWRSKGIKYPPDLDTLMIKAQISMESSFDAGNYNRIARGLMGITGSTRRDLGGQSNKGFVDIRKGQLVLTPEELFDPIVNIAAGIRWLGYKYSAIRRHPKNAESMFRYYKDAETGEPYAKEVLRRYHASR